ncbi:unnamed protein product [Brassica rapa]|uniref:Uncharacterized protein n=1 Tax=Brassica campestris TaxID=3711 RepID=A0A8D9CY58_BRACM|nr:unnamed protein product [Brassica rapa]
MSCVCWRTPTDVLCVLTRQPTWAKITRTVHRKGQRAESNDQRADMCTDGQPQTSCMDSHGRPVCADGHTWTHTDVLCVLTDTHGRPVHTRSHTDSHRRLVCADGQPQTATDVLCALADTHRHNPRGPKSPEQFTGRVNVLSPRTNVLICVLMDSHRPAVCADGHTQTHTDSPEHPVCANGHTLTQPMWAKIIQTVHGKGQRADSKDQRADMCTDGQPQTSFTDTHGRTQTATEVLCVLADTHGRPVYVLCVLTDTHRRPVCADGHPQTSCVYRTDSPGVPKSPKQSKGMDSVLSPRTSVLICVLMDSHGRPVCAE